MSSDLFHNYNKCTCIISVMYVKGVRRVVDLFDENENILDFETLKGTFNIQMNY